MKCITAPTLNFTCTASYIDLGKLHSCAYTTMLPVPGLPAGDKEHLKNLAGDMGAVKGAGLGTVQVGRTTRRHRSICCFKQVPQCGGTASCSLQDLQEFQGSPETQRL
jgi:hypothetical protein